MGILRLSCRPAGGENAGLVVDVVLEEAGTRRTASAQVEWTLEAQDREEVRWYLEDYLEYPVDPAPQIAHRVEGRLQALGAELFTGVFEANRDMTRLWDAVAGALPNTRVEVTAGAGVGVLWEWLRDPATDGALAQGRCAVPVGGQSPGPAEQQRPGGIPARCAAPADVRRAGAGARGSTGGRRAISGGALRWPRRLARCQRGRCRGYGRRVQPEHVFDGVAAPPGITRVPGIRGPARRGEPATGRWPGAGRGARRGRSPRCWC